MIRNGENGVTNMIKYEEWVQSVKDLQSRMEDFFQKTKYLDQEQVIIPDLIPTAESLYVQEQLGSFCRELEEAYYQAKRLNAGVELEGRLRTGYNGRFWLENEELTCGRSIELLYHDGQGLSNVPSWHAGHIDHDGNRYYFSGKHDLPLEGVMARIKQHL